MSMTVSSDSVSQEAEELLSQYQAVMCGILKDSRMVKLQQEGGALLSWLRRENSSISSTEEYRAQVEAAESLYQQVDELLHRLVMLSNTRMLELQRLSECRSLKDEFSQVRKTPPVRQSEIKTQSYTLSVCQSQICTTGTLSIETLHSNHAENKSV